MSQAKLPIFVAQKVSLTMYSGIKMVHKPKISFLLAKLELHAKETYIFSKIFQSLALESKTASTYQVKSSQVK